MLFAASAAPGFAGAWTEAKGAFYDRAAFNYFYSNETFNSSGSRGRTADSGKFTDYNFSNYFEYGVTGELTLVNTLAYKWLENDNATQTTRGYGLGDMDLGIRYKLLDNEKAGIVSTQLLLKVPGPYDQNDPLPLGNGQLDTELRLLYGRSLYPLIPGYGNVEIGYRWRAKDPSDEIRYLVEFGLDFSSQIYARAKLDGILSLDNGKKRDTSGNPTTTNNFDLAKLDLTVGYKAAPDWGVELSYVPTVYGQSTAAGATYTLALYLKTP